MMCELSMFSQIRSHMLNYCLADFPLLQSQEFLLDLDGAHDLK